MSHARAIAPEDRLIVALDVPSRDEALRFVESLGDAVRFYKVGLELFTGEGPGLVRELRAMGKQVFLDLKMDDVGETIERAVRQVARLDVQLLTILGGVPTAQAAARGKGEAALKVLQVTLLTSLGEDDLRDLMLLGPDKRFQSVEDYVRWRGEQAIGNGCDGLISSAQNARMLREHVGDDFVLVCPGIRPSGAATQDHKRPATPYNAIQDGADYLVVGRPIRDAADRPGAARGIVEEIARALAG